MDSIVSFTCKAKHMCNIFSLNHSSLHIIYNGINTFTSFMQISGIRQRARAC